MPLCDYCMSLLFVCSVLISTSKHTKVILSENRARTILENYSLGGIATFLVNVVVYHLSSGPMKLLGVICFILALSDCKSFKLDVFQNLCMPMQEA